MTFYKINTLLDAIKNNNLGSDGVVLDLKNIKDKDLEQIPRNIKIESLSIRRSIISKIPDLDIYNLEIVGCSITNITIPKITNQITFRDIINAKSINIDITHNVEFYRCFNISKININKTEILDIDGGIDPKTIPAGNYRTLRFKAAIPAMFKLNKNVTTKTLYLYNCIINTPINNATRILFDRCDIDISKVKAETVEFSECTFNKEITLDCDVFEGNRCKNLSISNKSSVRKKFSHHKCKADQSFDFLSKHPIKSLLTDKPIKLSAKKKITITTDFVYENSKELDMDMFNLSDGINVNAFNAILKNLPERVFNRLNVKLDSIKHLNSIIANELDIVKSNDNPEVLSLENLFVQTIRSHNCRLTINSKKACILNTFGFVPGCDNYININNKPFSVKYACLVDGISENYEIETKYGTVQKDSVNSPCDIIGYVIADRISMFFTKEKKIAGNTVYHNKYTNEYLIVDANGISAHGCSLKQARKDLQYKYYVEARYRRNSSTYKDFKKDTVVSREFAIKMYREITGACEFGVNKFLSKFDSSNHALANTKKLTVGDIIDITKDNYGHEYFERFFN